MCCIEVHKELKPDAEYPFSLTDSFGIDGVDKVTELKARRISYRVHGGGKVERAEISIKITRRVQHRGKSRSRTATTYLELAPQQTEALIRALTKAWPIVGGRIAFPDSELPPERHRNMEG